MKGNLTRVALAFALAASMAIGFAAPTDAATANQCKVFKGYATFKPPVPLANGPKVTSTITVHGTVSGCSPTKLTGGSGTVTGTIKGTKPGNCADTVKGGNTQKGTSTTKWKNGKSSTYSVTYHDGSGSIDKIETVTMTGTVTKDLFKGKKFTAGFKINAAGANNGACTNTPFKSAPWKSTKAWVISTLV